MNCRRMGVEFIASAGVLWNSRRSQTDRCARTNLSERKVELSAAGSRHLLFYMLTWARDAVILFCHDQNGLGKVESIICYVLWIPSENTQTLGIALVTLIFLFVPLRGRIIQVFF